MPSTRDPRETIDALRRKAADSSVSPEEREALLAKAIELENRHGIDPPKPPPETHPYISSKVQPMSWEEFVRRFHSTPSGLRIIYIPQERGKTFYQADIASWLSSLDEDPEQNEWGSGWQDT